LWFVFPFLETRPQKPEPWGLGFTTQRKPVLVHKDRARWRVFGNGVGRFKFVLEVSPQWFWFCGVPLPTRPVSKENLTNPNYIEEPWVHGFFDPLRDPPPQPHPPASLRRNLCPAMECVVFVPRAFSLLSGPVTSPPARWRGA